jgi:hypothetical protein
MLMNLTPEQRDRIQRLLEEELRNACRSAIDRGTPPAEVTELVVNRRRALEDLLADLTDDAEHPVDSGHLDDEHPHDEHPDDEHPVDDGRGIGGQR